MQRTWKVLQFSRAAVFESIKPMLYLNNMFVYIGNFVDFFYFIFLIRKILIVAICSPVMSLPKVAIDT